MIFLTVTMKTEHLQDNFILAKQLEFSSLIPNYYKTKQFLRLINIKYFI